MSTLVQSLRMDIFYTDIGEILGIWTLAIAGGNGLQALEYETIRAVLCFRNRC